MGTWLLHVSGTTPILIAIVCFTSDSLLVEQVTNAAASRGIAALLLRSAFLHRLRRQRLAIAGQHGLLEHELDLAIHAAHFLLGPALERLVERGVQPQQE